ncbi:hypothetical protein K8I61_17185 [bacterium]|nr:hypothetical protein [bacterium]
MPAHRVLFRYHDVDDPRFFNDQLAGFIPEGVHRGYTCEIGSSPENVSIRPGQIMTRKGESIFLDTALANYFRADTLNEIPANAGANPRHDLIVLEFVYVETWPDQPEPIYFILEGADEAGFTLPTYNQYQTPIAIGRCQPGQQTYDLLVPFPERWVRNAVYDHVAGVWKIVDGAVMAARIQFIGKDFSELTGWEPGLRIELIAPGTLADDAEIEESDWQLVADYGIGGERVVADAITELHRLVDLHLWDDVIQRGVVAGGRVTNDGGTGITVDPVTVVTRQGYRVERTDPAAATIPLNTDSTNTRTDLVVARHNHTPPGAVPPMTIEIVPGTTAPSVDVGALPSDGEIIAFGLVEPLQQQYAHIVHAGRRWYSNCYYNDDHEIRIIYGDRGAFYVEVSPNINPTLGYAPNIAVYWHAGGVADDADITSGIAKVWELNGSGVVANVAEVVTARGNKTSLNARLNVVLDADGNLKADTVGNTQLQDDAVNTNEIVNNAVVTAKINDLAVTTGKIDNLSVTSAKLANGAVTLGKIAADAVATANLENLAVETAKIDNLAVTEAKLAASAVTNSKIANSAVDANKIAASSVVNSKLGIKAVTADKVNYFTVSGNASRTDSYTAGSLTDILQRIKVAVPTGLKLYLRHARYSFTDASMHLHVSVSGASSWESADNEDDIDANIELYDNSAGGTPTDVLLIIRAKNAHISDPATLSLQDGWSCELSFE